MPRDDLAAAVVRRGSAGSACRSERYAPESMAARRPPHLRVERSFWDEGVEYVVGIDEVGRGAWAGPLTIGAAVVPRDRRVNRVRDSKQLTELRREALFDRLAEWCDGWAVGHASAEECDRLGMSEAQRLATRRALGQLEAVGIVAGVALVDGKWDFVGGGPTGRTATHTIVKGDATSLSIATASIIAKVTRDRIMREFSDDFPAYHFDANKGYPCPRHQVALQGYGPSSIHRRTWVFMDHLVWPGLHRPVPDDPEPAGDQLTLDLTDAELRHAPDARVGKHVTPDMLAKVSRD